MISSEQLVRYILKTDEEARTRFVCFLPRPTPAAAAEHTPDFRPTPAGQAKEFLRRSRARSVAKEGRRMLARLDSGTGNSLLALRARLNEEAKQRGKA
jgi:hypothetical protein